MSWPAGTLVYCVDAAGISGSFVPALREGCLYTIRDGLVPNLGTITGRVLDARTGVRLMEITGELAPAGHEIAFRRERFRLAEGGACEKSRAHSMKPQEISK